MATNLDLFLKIDGIDGESIKSAHEKEIDILTWQFTAQQPVAAGAMGAATGKVRMSDITVTKPVDASSPAMFLACCEGKNLLKAKITGQKATGVQDVYYAVELENVTISAISNSSISSETELDTILETVTMNATKMKMEYWPILNGKKGGVKSATYDFGLNKKA